MGDTEQCLRYVDSQAHRSNLRGAIDQCAVREPDLELVAADGGKIYGHRSVLGIFSPLLVELFSHTPCCQVATLVFPDSSSETLSHLLNMLYTGSTEASSDSMTQLTGDSGVFAIAALLGIAITPEQKVIEVLDSKENIVEGEEGGEEEERLAGDLVIDTGEEEGDREREGPGVQDSNAERMEICPSIPMFDLAGLATLAQWHGQQEQEQGQEVQEYNRLGRSRSEVSEGAVEEASAPQENEDYYICKLPSCQTMIMFENCGARSKILNHYTSHFQRELEESYGHLLTADLECTLCGRALRNYIKSKIWIHIGVTHDKTNSILVSKGIAPIGGNIRPKTVKVLKRKASDMYPEEVDPRFDAPRPLAALPAPAPSSEGELVPGGGSSVWGGSGGRNNTCKICGQVTQNRKRLLKHYCTRHFIDRLGALEFSFIVRNKCVECGRDFVGAKKSSKVIHIGVEHKQIFSILEAEFGRVEGVPRMEYTPPVKRPRALPPLLHAPGEGRAVPDAIPLAAETAEGDDVMLEGVPQLWETFPPAPPLLLPPLPTLQKAPMAALPPAPLVVPKAKPPPQPLVPVQHNLPRVQLDMSGPMMAIQALGNICLVCGKTFDLFRSMLLPHYCGHFYKEIAQGHEEYFTEENCKLCGAKATKRKSRIIHLGVKHELVLPYIQEIIKARGFDSESVSREDIEAEMKAGMVEVKQEEGGEEVEGSPVKEETAEEVKVKVEEVEDSSVEELPVHLQLPVRVPEGKRPGSKLALEEGGGGVKEGGGGVKEGGGGVKEGGGGIKEGGGGAKNSRNSSPAPRSAAPSPAPRSGAPSPAPRSAAPSPAPRSAAPSPAPPRSTAPSPAPVQRGKAPPVKSEPAPAPGLTLDSLGLSCLLCPTTEVTPHEMLTHYCSHFNPELRTIAEKNIDEEHKCRECGKMLGNNKRRLLHFGVLHLHVLPLINHQLSLLPPPEEEQEQDTLEEDDFEVTLDTVTESPTKKASPQKTRKMSGNPRTCEICGVKRNTNANLLRHYSREHFAESLKTQFSHLMSGSECRLCGEVVDCSTRQVGEAEKWVHLGVRHGKTNLLLEQLGHTQVLVKEKGEAAENNGVALPPPARQILDNSSPPPPPESPELFSCDLCDKKTKNQSLLNLHLIGIHFKKDILASFGNPANICKVCGKTLPNPDAFAFHMGQDHDLLEHMIKKRAEKEVKAVHDEVVEDVGDAQFACFKCGSRSQDKAALYGHYSLQHFSQELMGEFGVHSRCTVADCGTTCDSGTTWIEHIGEVHSAVEKYLPVEHHLPSPTLSCPLNCTDVFFTELQLTEHFRGHHGFSQEVVQKMKMRNYSLKTTKDT